MLTASEASRIAQDATETSVVELELECICRQIDLAAKRRRYGVKIEILFPQAIAETVVSRLEALGYSLYMSEEMSNWSVKTYLSVSWPKPATELPEVHCVDSQ